MKKLIIADDHPLVLDGLQMLLERQTDITIVDTALNGAELLDKIEKTEEVDVIILDINMPGKDGIEVTRILKKKHPEIKILILSMYNKSEFAKNLYTIGADGYVLKNSGKEALLNAIHSICAGNRYFAAEVLENSSESQIEHDVHKDLALIELTDREKEIVQLIAEEKSTSEIAAALFISIHTVNTHRKSILSKIGVKNVAGIFRYAVQTGIIKGFDL